MRATILNILIFILVLEVNGQGQIPVTVENHSDGAPITMGIPFPIGTLYSPDKIRVLDGDKKEIPSQVTEVTTWEPKDHSIKWVWVFFFTNHHQNYSIEYGDKVVRGSYGPHQITSVNNRRSRGYIEVNTGTLKWRINKGDGGFISTAALDVDNNGFYSDEVIAQNEGSRGTFLDILDDLGLDQSRAVVYKTYKERGSGPLHTIIRIEGEYLYSRDDNNPSPFITRIHSYAGKSYIKVLHTIIYTGEPDKHPGYEGEHANIATQNEKIIEKYDETDSSFMQPNDRIAAAGFHLNYNIKNNEICQIGYEEKLHAARQVYRTDANTAERISVRQSGNAVGQVSASNGGPGEFEANVMIDDQTKLSTGKGEGWVDISDSKWGVAVGIRNYHEEYPKGFDIKAKENSLLTYLWPPDEKPMSFARTDLRRDGQMLDNFAQGLAKTTEITLNFHSADQDLEQTKKELSYFTNPTVAHADPDWYANSLAFGHYSPARDSHAEYERGLSYKFDWMLHNQKWERWHGMFDYGDFKTYFYNNKWYQWSNNEPAQDQMLWMNYLRTGNPKYYNAAEAASRHTMDVDNIHWPTFPEYNAASNDAVDYWNYEDQEGGTPYLGIGRRHARQQWTALLSAHVWIQGWITSYYVSGYHRGLEIARLTGEAYMRRIWGEHDLTGRRLYLSVQNLTELWDATKDESYRKELVDRVDRMLRLQNGPDQYGSLVMDRYGYAQVYASQGLSKYYQITGDERVKQALIKHARAVRDVPPWNHKYESYLSTIHSLLVGYEYSGEPSLLTEAIKRAEVLKTDKLPKPIGDYSSQQELAEALKEVSHLPENPQNRDVRGEANWSIRQGLRVFGWTHAYNVPHLLYWLRTSGK